jgi:hypothetical protein
MKRRLLTDGKASCIALERHKAIPASAGCFGLVFLGVIFAVSSHIGDILHPKLRE